MGGSGGGGGSAGEVSWPSGVQDRYDALLGGPTLVSGSSSAWQALHDAQVLDPYDDDAYDPGTVVNSITEATSQFYLTIDDHRPSGLWDLVFNQAFDRYNRVVGNDPIYLTPEPSAADEIRDNWAFIEPALDAPDNIKDNWEDPEYNAPTDIKADLADEAEVTASTDAHRAVLSDQLTTEVFPRFEAGMRDINAVQSSAFVIGRAIIEGMGARDVAKFDADLRYKAFLQRDQLLGQAHMQIDKLEAVDVGEKNKLLSQAYLQEDKIQGEEALEGQKMRASAFIQADKIMADSDKAASLINAEMTRNKITTVLQDTDAFMKHDATWVDFIKAWTAFRIDSNRIMYVMSKEQNDQRIDYNARAARWDLDMVQMAGNLVASISGGTSYTMAPTTAQNALGGAFAGASIGAKASGGNPVGAAAGAILGGIGAYLMG